ncbi:MAG: peroxidase family protein [Gemmatimonadales bacterium]
MATPTITPPPQRTSGRLPPSATKRAPTHGGGIRGADTVPRSVQFEGTFGRMFRTLPAAEHSEDDLRTLARAMTAEPEARKNPDGSFVKDPSGFISAVATPEGQVDDEENFGIPAGYTYLGQFIDHDLTFDPASSLQRQNDPDALVDFRTPRFDLDSVYGRGPADQPYMYDDDQRTFALGEALTAGTIATGVRDLPRFGARALIGDKRNDENVIVSQLQGLFLRFHNAVAGKFPEASFEQVQRIVRWHYQWICLHDFLRRVAGEKNLHAVLPHLKTGGNIYDHPPQLHFYHYHNDPYIPIEFTVAAYRFGHSMVRPIYRLNTELGKPGKPEDDKTGRLGRQLVFAGLPGEGLNGFRKFNRQWAIDWSLFFEVGATLSPENTINRGTRRVQPSYKIDTSLVDPLGFLPEFSAGGPAGKLTPDQDGHPRPKGSPGGFEISNLAHRNLLRGMRMGLPSGQAVARFMGLTPLPDAAIRIGKATFANDGNNPSITSLSSSFEGNAPLWCYILAEAQHGWSERARQMGDEDKANAVPVHLGPVGGRIVTEVFVGLLLGDRHSFLSQAPAWKPDFADRKTGRFEMPELVKVAKL